VARGREAGDALVVTRRDLLRGGLTLLGAVLGVDVDSRAAAAELIKGVYLSYYGIGDRAIRNRVLELLDRTELNAVVVDVKGDRGFIPYETKVPLAVQAGAQGPVRLVEFDQVLAGLKGKGIYTIARVVTFKDHVLAHHRPEWAVRDVRTGGPWLDREGLAWLDPFQAAAWEYPIAVAREAALKGFEEIQFDYLRFPSEGTLGAIRYAEPSTQRSRLGAIVGFLQQARAALAPIGVRLAIDVFGYAAFNQDDIGIGQRVEELAPVVDCLCPMAYPSAYRWGIPHHPDPVAHPYEVVFETVRRIRERAAPRSVQVRPWIQDFRDYAFDRRLFGPAEVRAEMAAAHDAGAEGWMLWNPSNRYTVEALNPKPRPG